MFILLHEHPTGMKVLVNIDKFVSIEQWISYTRLVTINVVYKIKESQVEIAAILDTVNFEVDSNVYKEMG